MRKLLTLRFAAMASALLLCSSLILNSNARAQCTCPPLPTDDAQHNPASPPWTGPYSTTQTIDGCTVTICYASRMTSTTNYDYCITQICVQQPCATNIDQLRNDASAWLLNNNPQNYPCPTCPSRDIEWSESMASCWKTYTTVYNGDTIVVHQMCPEHGWCLTAYYVCCGGPAGAGKHFTYDRRVTTTYQCKSDEGCNQVDCPPNRDNNQ
jgi:hypothetical protein